MQGRDSVSGWGAPVLGAPIVELQSTLSELSAGQVEITVDACGLCHSDLHLLDNAWGTGGFPVIPGHEVVGRVVDAGTTDLALGTRVGVGWFAGACGECEWCAVGDDHLCKKAVRTCMGHAGGFADRIRVDARWAHPLPDSLLAAHAAPLLCAGSTVFAPLLRFDGMRVAVVGIGGLGHLAVQFARKSGREVHAYTHSPDKVTEALALGAHTVGDTRAPAKNAYDLVLVTNHESLDWDRWVRALRPRGVLCLLGVPDQPAQFSAGHLVGLERSVVGGLTPGREGVRRALAFAAEHAIVPRVEVMPFALVATAIDRLRKGDVRYRFVLER